MPQVLLYYMNCITEYCNIIGKMNEYSLSLAPAKLTDSNYASKNSLPLSQQATSFKSGTVLLFYQIMIHCKFFFFSCGV